MKPNLLQLSAVLCLMTISLDAATLTVTSTADSGPGTLREALAIAADGDTIDATGVTGTILLTSGELLVSKSLNILGGGPDKLAVDGNASSGIFIISPSNTVTIADMRIANGKTSSPGGGVFSVTSTLVVSNCIFYGNSAGGAGGAIYNWDYWEDGNTIAIIVNCTLIGNSAYGSGGGGIYNGGRMAITNCVIADNLGMEVWGDDMSGGGGLRNEGEATVASTTFSNNVSQSVANADFVFVAGGAINNWGDVSIINCTIQDNWVVGYQWQGDQQSVIPIGGGVSNVRKMNLIGTTIGRNSLSHTAGDKTNGVYELSGIYTTDYLSWWGKALDATLQVINSTITRSDILILNYSGGSSLTILGSTFSQATLANVGRLEIGSTILNATSLRSNWISNFTSLGFNLSSDDGGGFLTNATDLVNADPMLGPLQDNGGPTWTHALLPGSPAIDRGFSFSGSLTDQRDAGFVRTVDDLFIANAPSGDGTDIGAYEVQTVTPPPDSDGDGVLDDVDECPNTPAGDIVNAQGCSIAQLVPCDGPTTGGTWKNHGHYVRAVLQSANTFLKAGLITRQQWRQIVLDAARSRCGWNRRFDRDRDWNWHHDRDDDRAHRIEGKPR